jgi:cyclopropane fatty-acyl-phospholipid synthase-like methyltransferase
VDDVSGSWNAVAADYISRRSSRIGVATVRKWAADLPPGGSVLDLGCGHGVPISAALMEDGFKVYGIDASPILVEEFRQKCPDALVRCEPVETSDFFDRKFDAVIAIGLMFLLSEDTQRQFIHRVSGVLNPGGRFLFTAPTQKVAWADNLTGRQSRSLGREEYEAALRKAGFELLAGYTDEGENHYYSAKRSTAPAR